MGPLKVVGMGGGRRKKFSNGGAKIFVVFGGVVFDGVNITPLVAFC